MQRDVGVEGVVGVAEAAEAAAVRGRRGGAGLQQALRSVKTWFYSINLCFGVMHKPS
jgi:hypothetical protein